MFRIGIVDDQQESRGLLRSYLARYSAENATEFMVEEFSFLSLPLPPVLAGILFSNEK